MSAPALRFTLADALNACDEWGANRGPGAVAAITGLTLDELRPYLGDFEKKHFTNPTLMQEILRQLHQAGKLAGASVRWWNPLKQCNSAQEARRVWPRYGLARVQWEGPWTATGVPIRVRYRHTHWIACVSQGTGWTVPGWEEPRIFDINCMCVGGWVSLTEWTESVVPWLLKECEPKANGKWHLTHVVEIENAPVARTTPSSSELAQPDTSAALSGQDEGQIK